MTSDFDELASAYLDGETTEADAARVESDDDLQARVSELRAVAEGLNADVVPPDEMLKRRQIGAALDAFDALNAPEGSLEAGATRDAAGAQAAPPPIDFDRRRAGRRDRTGPAGLPRWLSVAAVLLLVVGGVGLLAQLGGGGDDAFETATDELDASDAGDDASSETVEAATAAEQAEPVAGEALAEGDGEESEADFASDEEASAEDDGAASADDRAESEDEGGDAAGTDATAAPSTTTSREATTGGFFPEDELEEATVAFADVPDRDELLALADGPRFDPILARCAAELEGEIGGVLFFVPVSVGGIDGEALFTGSEADLVVVLVDRGCESLG